MRSIQPLHTVLLHCRSPLLHCPTPAPPPPPQVVVSKRSAFTPDELAALKRLVLAANITSSEDRPARGARAR